MNCPVCGSEIPAGVKYCPVCGTDVEEAEMRTQQASRVAPTQQMPMQQPAPNMPANPMAQAQQRAVPMNSSMPPVHENTRNFDTSKMGGSPKWPIVVIAVLAVAVIVLVVLLVVRGCDSTPTTPAVDQNNPSATTPVTPVTPAADGTTAPVVGDDPAATPATASGALDNTAAYNQLTAAYDQLNGLHTQISSVAADFSNNIGVSDMTDVRNRAASIQDQVTQLASTVDALNIAAESPYAATKSAISSLLHDLDMRVSVLVEACDADMAGQDFSAILSRDNGEPDEHGHTNIYLIDYEQNYEGARPVQQ